MSEPGWLWMYALRKNETACCSIVKLWFDLPVDSWACLFLVLRPEAEEATVDRDGGDGPERFSPTLLRPGDALEYSDDAALSTLSLRLLRFLRLERDFFLRTEGDSAEPAGASASIRLPGLDRFLQPLPPEFELFGAVVTDWCAGNIYERSIAIPRGVC